MSNAPKKPVHTVRDGLLKVAIWENEGQNDRIYHSVQVIKSYKDKKTGEFHETTNFNKDDLLKLSNLLQEAYNYIRTRKSE